MVARHSDIRSIMLNSSKFNNITSTILRWGPVIGGLYNDRGNSKIWYAIFDYESNLFQPTFKNIKYTEAQKRSIKQIVFSCIRRKSKTDDGGLEFDVLDFLKLKTVTSKIISFENNEFRVGYRYDSYSKIKTINFVIEQAKKSKYAKSVDNLVVLAAVVTEPESWIYKYLLRFITPTHKQLWRSITDQQFIITTNFEEEATTIMMSCISDFLLGIHDRNISIDVLEYSQSQSHIMTHNQQLDKLTETSE